MFQPTKQSATRTRKIVHIDEDLCDGCGLCVPSCAEGAIKIIDGKAKLVAENLCDGLGACLGTCPKDAIKIEERPAEEFDEAAVAKHQGVHQNETKAPRAAIAGHHQGCPGSALRHFEPPRRAVAAPSAAGGSQLRQWPVQLTLLPPTGRLWQDADILIAADCVPTAMPDFHQNLLAGKTLAIACPKLDDVEPYVDKLTTVFSQHRIKHVTVALMEVPCCRGIASVVLEARRRAKATFPMTVVVIGIHGEVAHTEEISGEETAAAG
jgi:NAD-dependent dihydropyrimidine dehydrogenase PreA subunit